MDGGGRRLPGALIGLVGAAAIIGGVVTGGPDAVGGVVFGGTALAAAAVLLGRRSSEATGTGPGAEPGDAADRGRKAGPGG